MQRLGVLSLPFLLAACVALPPQLALVTQAADGVSYVLTGRSATDHIVSAAMKEDCALSRAAQGRAICKAKQGDSDFAQALSQVEGGHPGAALDRPIGHDEIVALDPVLLPQELAALAPALGGAAQAPPPPVMGSAAFADPRRFFSPASHPKASPPKAPQPKATPTPRPDPTYYVVVGNYRNWVTAVENAGRQSQGITSVVTATRNGAKTHRVLIGPLDRVRAGDTRRLVWGEGYRSAWLVRSCAGGSATGGPAQVRGQACMDLRKTWR